MLLFSAMLQINRNLTKDKFIKLVIEWNQGSPYENNIIRGIDWHGERNVRYGNENLWLDIEEYQNQNIIAVRYEKREADGVIWDTDYVMNFNTFRMVVRLDRSYTAEALSDDGKFSTPHFITLLIERGYLEDDDDLPVLRTPDTITKDRLEQLARIINGEKRYRLPVVYVSRTYNNEDPVNVKLLASRLKGAAHVLVQEDRETNYELKHLCDKKNEYYGAIGVYFPNPAISNKRYLYRSAVGYDDFLMQKVVQLVIRYVNTQTVDMLYTWQGVNNCILMDRLQKQRDERAAAEAARRAAEEEKLRILDTLSEEERRYKTEAVEEAKAAADKILEGFDDDLQKLQDQVDSLTKANEVLQYENQGLRAKLASTESVPLLYMGDEFEFYQEEIKDMILSVLDDAEKTLHPRSRRYDVVQNVVKSNNYKKLNAKRAEELKRLLKDYHGMPGPLYQQLEDMGFQITSDGKHYKLTYYGDERYVFTLAKTPSDFRGGKNATQSIINGVF